LFLFFYCLNNRSNVSRPKSQPRRSYKLGSNKKRVPYRLSPTREQRNETEDNPFIRDAEEMID